MLIKNNSSYLHNSELPSYFYIVRHCSHFSLFEQQQQQLEKKKFPSIADVYKWKIADAWLRAHHEKGPLMSGNLISITHVCFVCFFLFILPTPPPYKQNNWINSVALDKKIDHFFSEILEIKWTGHLKVPPPLFKRLLKCKITSG